MRSSIACIRCRRSKVKCVNNGVGTTCRSCDHAGRDCSYPDPVTTTSRKRESDSGRLDGFGDGERRQRPRKSNHAFGASGANGTKDGSRPLIDALDSRLLTPTVWQELFDIFQIHYSADLPFLHPPTFLKPLRHATMQQQASLHPPTESTTNVKPPASTEFLLAFLALTARFHPKLVAHHSPPTSTRPSNPLIASEYYAAAAGERLAAAWNDGNEHEITRTQALLMLGLHEWGMCRGGRAWVTVGTAIRLAQAMGLQYEMDLDDEPLSRSLALNYEAARMGVDGRVSSSAGPKGEGEAFIQQEIRRRTFWSCFVMDRYLSSGKYRPQMLHVKELRIQLPASEQSFLFGEKVRTLMLGEEENTVGGRTEVQNQRHASVMLGTTPEPKMGPSSKDIALQEPEHDRARSETGPDEGLISRYIKILEIYGKVVKWSCAGGRRVEEHPPWDSRCEFYQLRKQCVDFIANLPPKHSLTPQNTQAHISLKTSTPYMLVHTICLLSQIMLHREYVPFIPIRCSKPEGPLDPPMFSPDKYDVPPGFWEDSALQCFKSARQIMDLVRSCQEWNALVETPIVGFAIYTVAFVGVYCLNFPWMDPEGYMSGPRTSTQIQSQDKSRAGQSPGSQAAHKAVEMIGHMRKKLQMADGWFKTITRMYKYFKRIQRDYNKNTASNATSESDGSPFSNRHLSLREGGAGGGLDEFKLLERTLQDFGNLANQDVEMEDVEDQPGSPRGLDPLADGSSTGTAVKSEEVENRVDESAEQNRTEGGPWNAINTVSGALSNRQESLATPTSGQFRSYGSYQQSHSAPVQQQMYAQQVTSFRPAYSHDHTGAPNAPPSLTSPGSNTLSTPSQPSPPYDRQHQQYSGWSPHGVSYPMQPPQGPYANGISHQHHAHQQATPIQTSSAYQTPSHHPQQQMPPPMHVQEQHQHQHQPWSQMEKEAFLNGLNTRLGGDDFAAFTDGGDMAEWATMAARYGYGDGWLTTIWGGGRGAA